MNEIILSNFVQFVYFVDELFQFNFFEHFKLMFKILIEHFSASYQFYILNGWGANLSFVNGRWFLNWQFCVWVKQENSNENFDQLLQT